MKGIVSNPNIAPHIKQSVIAYAENNALEKFYTTIFFHQKNKTHNFLNRISSKFSKELNKRNLNEIPLTLIEGSFSKELLRVFSSRKLSAKLTDKIWEYNELNFDVNVARKLKINTDFIHVTEHASLAILKRAKELKILSFYEQPSVHHNTFSKIIAEEFDKYPELKSDNNLLLVNDLAKKRNKRRDEELAITDYIICNSSFTEKSLIDAGINSKKIIRIPLGFEPRATNTRIKNNKTIFLFVGNITVNKGAHLLLEAWQNINTKPSEAELWFVGRSNLPVSYLKKFNNVKFYGHLSKSDLAKCYENANILVLPTLADGFGMVLTEAMSFGLPILTSTNCAGPDLINNNESGIIIPAADLAALTNKLIWCLAHKNHLNEMGNNAFIKSKNYSWANYRTELFNQVKKKVSENQ